AYVEQNPKKTVISGEMEQAQLGASMARGDFNGDGYVDLVLGSPYYSSFDKEWNGAVYVIPGPVEEGEEFSLIQREDVIKILGEDTGDQLGSDIVVADFNNDGVDDLVISAFNGGPEGDKQGRVYIFYGELTGSGQMPDFSLEKPSVELAGSRHKDSFGLALSTVDINMDGFEDLLVGAPAASSDNVRNSGAVYLFFGGEDGFGKEAFSMDTDNASVTFYGKFSNERFGSKIAVGDVTGDNLVDVVIGAYKGSASDKMEAGKVYVFRGREKWFKTIRAYTAYILGEKASAWFGFDLDLGDMNGDGVLDIVVSSFPYKDQKQGGSANIFFGGSHFYDKGTALVESDGDVKVDGSFKGMMIGADVLVEDFDGDDRDDLIVGAPGVGYPESEYEGDLYVLYGADDYRKSYQVNDYLISSIIHGESADDWFGYRNMLADLNADGRQDLVVGARYAGTELGQNVGKVYVLFGKGKPFGTMKLITEPENMTVSRGEAIKIVVDRLNLITKKSEQLKNCLEYIDFCLFNFMAMSRYDEINFSPELNLYPDIYPDDEYFEAVNTATLLGLVNGYANEEGTPFHPELSLSRIEALKMILGAAGLVEPKYKFELVQELGSYDQLANQESSFSDINARISRMWWYPRYVNFAVENGIASPGEIFRPNGKITVQEFEAFVSRTIEYLNKQNAQEESSGDTEI
ncbi:FG-GAP repeat protein, partial [Patescibacteria group bacterium]|nr:FG-GAP repeat protein [Patescibacteria group bacterium]